MEDWLSLKYTKGLQYCTSWWLRTRCSFTLFYSTPATETNYTLLHTGLGVFIFVTVVFNSNYDSGEMMVDVTPFLQPSRDGMYSSVWIVSSLHLKSDRLANTVKLLLYVSHLAYTFFILTRFFLQGPGIISILSVLFYSSYTFSVYSFLHLYDQIFKLLEIRNFIYTFKYFFLIYVA